MITQNFYPSSYYPEYFKADIELGTEFEFRYSSELDSILHRFLISRFSHLDWIAGSQLSGEQARKTLNDLGFCVKGLSLHQINALYQSRFQLFQLRGTFAALDLLAQHYFTKFQSFQGLPLIKTRLGRIKLERVRLAQADDYRHWVTYVISGSVNPVLKDSFLKSSELFRPQTFKIHLSTPTEKLEDSDRKQPKGTFRNSFQLIKRRIPCPTFQR